VRQIRATNARWAAIAAGDGSRRYRGAKFSTLTIDHTLQPDPEVRRKFEAALAESRALAKKASGDDNATFASILARLV